MRRPKSGVLSKLPTWVVEASSRTGNSSASVWDWVGIQPSSTPCTIGNEVLVGMGAVVIGWFLWLRLDRSKNVSLRRPTADPRVEEIRSAA
jgi:hypothetical protein